MNTNESMTCNTCGNGGNMGCGNSCRSACGNGNWGGGHHRFFFLRMLLGIIILVIVFSVGVKVGELKGMFEGQYGGYGMMRGDRFNARFGPGSGQPMMYYNNQAAPTTNP